MKQLTFGAILKRWREIQGMSQREAAIALGVPKTTYISWEHGERHPSGKKTLELVFRIQGDNRKRKTG